MNLDVYVLSKMLSKQQIISLGLFNDGKKSTESNYYTYFINIADDKIKNDKEAIKYFKYSNVNSFKKFKERYLKKVLDYLILSELRIQEFDDRNKLYFELLKYFCAARVLHYSRNKKNAVILYEYIYTKSKKYGFTDMHLFSAATLREHYAFVDPSKKRYNEYVENVNFAKGRLEKKMNLDGVYDELSHKNVFINAEQDDDYKALVLRESEKLLATSSESDLISYQSKILELAAFAYSLNKDYKKSIDISLRSAELIKNDSKQTAKNVWLSYRDIATSFLKLKEYDNAKIYLNKALELLGSPGHNYFKTKGLEFSLYAVTKEFDHLFEIVNTVLTGKKISDVKMHKEEWSIREAFVNLLVETGRVSSEVLDNAPRRKFRLNRFINDVEFYSKDKRGMNISVQVVQLMHFLINKEYHKIVDRLDALNQYTYRYLRNDESLRSNCFIKMLLKLPEAEYHPLRTKRYVAKYEKKLAENPYEVSLKETDVEILPYEYLWEIIMETLEKNQKRRS